MTSGLATNTNDKDIVDSSEAASIDRHDDSSWQDDVSDDTQVKRWRKEQVGGNVPLDIRKLELELAIKQAVLEVEKMKIEADNQKAIIHQQTELKKYEIKQYQLKQELEFERMKIEANEERARQDRVIELEKCQLEQQRKCEESAKVKYDIAHLHSYLLKSWIGEYQVCKEAEVAAYDDLTSAIFNEHARNNDLSQYMRELDYTREKHDHMEQRLNDVVANLNSVDPLDI